MQRRCFCQDRLGTNRRKLKKRTTVFGSDGINIAAFRLTLKTYVDVESKMTYAERVFEYTDLPIEPPAKLKSDPSSGVWPANGQIEFRGVSMRYRDK